MLARAVDAKDTSTREHSERVADLAVALGTAIGWDSERLVRLREAGLVHDVGKIGVPDADPLQAGPPDAGGVRGDHAPRRRSAPRWWPTCSPPSRCRGCAATTSAGTAGATPTASPAIGSPRARAILALADAWDVMTSERPYHAPLTVAEALAECRRCAGTQFPAALVDAIGRLVEAGAVLPGI